MTALRIGRRAPALAVVLLLAACGPGGELVWPTPQMELHYSGPQQLVVSNDLNEQVTAATADGKSSTTLPPNGTLSLSFIVTTISELENSPRGPWYTPRGTGRFDLARETTTPAYLRTRDANLEIAIRIGDTAKIGLLTLQGCQQPWDKLPAAAGSRTVTVTQMTRVPGVPVTLCPPK